MNDWVSYFISFMRIYVHNGSGHGKVDTDVNWTDHGHKNFADKNKSWKDTVKSTKDGPEKYSKDISNIEVFEKNAWETGISTTNAKIGKKGI